MAIGTATALLVAGGAFTAATQIGAANSQAKAIQKQANYNAEVYGQQAEMIKNQKKLQEYQFNRDAARARGTIIARTAGKGFNMGGSPLAILIDNESQMQFDKAISDYNLDIEAQYAQTGAEFTRIQGASNSRVARYSGYTNAFSTLLNTGSTYAMRNLNYGKVGKL